MKIVTSFGPRRIERQRYCLSTWQRYELPIVAVQTHHDIDQVRDHFPGVEFVVDDRTGSEFGFGPTPRIRALLDQAVDEPILVVNSDISIKDDRTTFSREWLAVDPMVARIGIRHDRKASGEKSVTPGGIDVFRLTPTQAREIPDMGFAIGFPVWDWWLAWELIVAGWKLRPRIGNLLHQVHPCAWSTDDADAGWEVFAKRHRIDRHELGRILRLLTGREDKRAPKRFRPTAEQRTHQDRKIVIAGTPRTGSNLLLHSLAKHPVAINAGEVYCPHVPDSVRSRLASCADFVAECNLFKLFAQYEGRPNFRRIMGAGQLVYLYREDIDAQVESWERAAASGIWNQGQRVPTPTAPPSYARDLIRRAHDLFADRADFVISYEQMTHDWDGTITRVLDLAGWPRMSLPMATRRQTTEA